jgi:hypothetical protein
MNSVTGDNRCHWIVRGYNSASGDFTCVTEKSVACHAAGGNAAIDCRLAELDRERYALKALRGDFQDLPRAEEEPLMQAQEVVRRVCR